MCLDSKSVRDKEGRGNTPTVNSVNAGFEVAELLTKMNHRILLLFTGPASLKGSTLYLSFLC